MPSLQELIHKLEVGPWMRQIRIGLAVLALLGLFVGYNWYNFRNLGTQEAMDSAQIGRNLSEGKGYSTLFIRQLSIALIKKRHPDRRLGDTPDPAMLKGYHPDLANPPLYPMLLAAYMKVMPMEWEMHRNKPFWSSGGQFARYQPDFLIALLNEFLLFTTVVLTFLLARRLFDPGVAWLAGLLLLACELLWRFSVSGLSTMLLLLCFVGLAWFIVLVEAEVREPKRGPLAVLALAAGVGVMLALGLLTRYSFGWLLIPTITFLALFGGLRRAQLCLVALVVFSLLITPWIYRNLRLSGLPFGTATYAIVEGTPYFPEHKLARTIEPKVDPVVILKSPLTKLLRNGRGILQNELPRLGGNWISLLFLTGLLLGFRNPAIRRLRYFVVMCLGTLFLVQALGRTQLAEDSPDLNSENLLVLVVPFAFIYGVAFFYMMLDQMNLPFKGFRYVVIGLFGAVMALPMIFSFLPPRTNPVVYPYTPPLFRTIGGFMKDSELLMSDAPWAVAWYGNRQCVWLSPDARESFYAINDMLKPVRGLYLTQFTMESRFASEWLKATSNPDALAWGNFLLDCLLVRHGFPVAFPLKEALIGLLPHQFFLADWKRWDAKALPPVMESPNAPVAEPREEAPKEAPKEAPPAK